MQVLQIKRGFTMKTSKGAQLNLGCFFIARSNESLEMLKVAFDQIINKMIDEAELPQAKMFLQKFLEPQLSAEFVKEGNGDPMIFVRMNEDYAQRRDCDESIFIYEDSLDLNLEGKLTLPVHFTSDSINHEHTEAKVIEFYQDFAA